MKLNSYNKILIIFVLLIVVALVGVVYAYFKSMVKVTDNPQDTSNNIIATPEVTQPSVVREGIAGKLDKIFTFWDEVTSTEYKMVGSDGKVYFESTVLLDVKNQKYKRTNYLVQGLEKNVIYASEIVQIDGSEKVRLSDLTLSESSKAEYRDIPTFSVIKSNFMAKLENMKIQGIETNIAEEKISSGINRIRVKLEDPAGTNSDESKVYPYELLIEFTDSNEIKLIGVPFGNTYTLFTFKSYNQPVKIDPLS